MQYLYIERILEVKMKLLYIEQAIEHVLKEMEKSQNDTVKLGELLMQLNNLKDMKILKLEQRIYELRFGKVKVR